MLQVLDEALWIASNEAFWIAVWIAIGYSAVGLALLRKNSRHRSCKPCLQRGLCTCQISGRTTAAQLYCPTSMVIMYYNHLIMCIMVIMLATSTMPPDRCRTKVRNFLKTWFHRSTLYESCVWIWIFISPAPPNFNVGNFVLLGLPTFVQKVSMRPASFFINIEYRGCGGKSKHDFCDIARFKKVANFRLTTVGNKVQI